MQLLAATVVAAAVVTQQRRVIVIAASRLVDGLEWSVLLPYHLRQQQLLLHAGGRLLLAMAASDPVTSGRGR